MPHKVIPVSGYSDLYSVQNDVEGGEHVESVLSRHPDVFLMFSWVLLSLLHRFVL